MTQTIAYLEAVVGADITSFRREMQNVRRELGILSDSAAGLQHLGRTLTLGLTTPIIAAGVGIATVSAQFDAAMRNVASISQEMADNFDVVSERTRALGSNIRGGPIAAAEALYTVVSSGITDMDTAFAIAEAGAQTAQAGLSDIAGTTQALTSVMLAYGAEASEATTYSDILTRTVQVGVGTMEEFEGALSKIVPTANLLNISFEDVGAGLAFLTQRGIDASEASTALTGAIKKILNPTEDMQAAFAELGVSTGSELIEQFGGLEGAMRALIETAMTGGEVDEQKLFAMFNEVRAFKAAASFANDLDAFSESFRIFGLEVDGATDRALQQQMMSFSAQFDLAKAALEGFAITVGRAVLPIVTPFIQALRDLFNMAGQLPPELIAMGVAFAGVLAAAGPLLWVLGSLLTPVGLLLGVVSGLAVAFATNFNGVRDTIIDAVTTALPHVEDLTTAVSDFFKLITGDGEVAPPSELDYRSIFGENTIDVNVGEAITFTVEEGDYPIAIAAALQEAGHNVTWEQVLAATGSDAFLPGTYTMTVPGPSNVDIDLTNTVITMPNWWEQDITYETSGGTGSDNSLGGRLSRAVTEAWPKVQDALEGLKSDISNWFTKTFIPGFDSIGSDVLNAITGIFSGSNAGKDTGIYLAVRELLDGGVQGAAKDFAKTIGKNLPEISSAFNRLFNAVGEWLRTDGIPGFAQTLGYLLGTIGTTIRDGISNAINSVFGSGEVSETMSEAGTRFSEGFNQALIDTGHADDSSFVNNILTGLAGAIVAGLAAKTFVGLLVGKGIGGALSGALALATKGLSLVLDAGSWLISLAGNAVGKTGLGTALSTAISAALLPVKAGLMVMLDQLSFALFAGKYYVTLAGQAIVSALSTFVTTALASAGVITITAGVVAIAATIAAATFVVLGVNYGAREAMATWLENELGQDPIDVNIFFGINPILDIGSEASQNELWGAFEENGTVGMINQMLFRDPNGNTTPVQIDVPVEIVPNLQVNAAASDADTNNSLMGEMTGGEYFTELPEEMRPKYQAGGAEIGKEVKAGLTTELGTGTANLIEQALAAQFAETDFTVYVPTANLTDTAALMTLPFETRFTGLLGEGGLVHTLFTSFADLVANATPDIVAAVTTMADDLIMALTPLYNLLYGVVTMLGGITGNPQMGLEIPAYASGGVMNGAGFVGGRGMEFFAPGEQGSILPARKLRDFMSGNRGNGSGDTYIINSYGESPHRLSRMVERSQRDRARNTAAKGRGRR